MTQENLGISERYRRHPLFVNFTLRSEIVEDVLAWWRGRVERLAIEVAEQLERQPSEEQVNQFQSERRRARNEESIKRKCDVFFVANYCAEKDDDLFVNLPSLYNHSQTSSLKKIDYSSDFESYIYTEIDVANKGLKNLNLLQDCHDQFRVISAQNNKIFDFRVVGRFFEIERLNLANNLI